MKKSELRQMIKEEIRNVNESSINFNEFWKAHDAWAKLNKYPSWKLQKKNMVKIAPSFGINISITEWAHIFKIYHELFRKFYFGGGWDKQTKPWFEKQINKIAKP